ncbi:MAG: hypothetical protein ACUVQT_09980 [bacterium]
MFGYKREQKKTISAILTILLSALIVWDFNYLNPGISIFMKENKAYSEISGKQAKVTTIPFQLNSADYRNSTFLPLALKYDLRLFTGHSSFYPKDVDSQVQNLFSLNNGMINHEQWQWLYNNGYQYVIAHATEFEPRVDAGVIATLEISGYLEFLMEDQGVFIYKVRDVPIQTTDHNTNNSADIDYYAWAQAINKVALKYKLNTNEIQYIYGWYTRETYPNQKPFRWMQGIESLIAINMTKSSDRTIEFEYLSPYNKPLKIEVKLATAEIQETRLNDGWTKVILKLHNPNNSFAFVKLVASQLFEAPPDVRKFGRQIGDIILK